MYPKCPAQEVYFVNFSVQTTKEKTYPRELTSPRWMEACRQSPRVGPEGPSGEGLHSGLEIHRSGPGQLRHVGRQPRVSERTAWLPNIHFTNRWLRVPGSLLQCTINLGICKLSP